jgi:TRAP-type C4-dicarboxylate transport system permease small subunit
VFAATSSLAFTLTVAVLSFQFWHQAWSSNWVSDTMWRAQLWIPYASMPIGFGILSLQYVADLLNLATGREPPFGLPPKPRRA